MELGWGKITTDTFLKLPLLKSYSLVTRLGILHNRRFGTAFFAVEKPFLSSVYEIRLTAYDVYMEESVRDLSKFDYDMRQYGS
jgi:hypothetical protein